MTALDEATLRELPKVELHVHLEGTLSGEAIATLADAVGEPLPRPVEQLFTFDGLTSFLQFLDWTCSLIRTPATAADVAYAYAATARANGVHYAEVIINPTHWGRWALDPLVEALTDGFDRAARDGLADCNLLLSILRPQSGEEALALVDWMDARRPARVVGLSIDGNEQAAGRTGPRFAPAYEKARAAGFGCTAHAGESSGVDGVLDAVELLRVHRLDHGVRAVDDPALVRRLADEGITLNVCLSSNLIHLYPDLDGHPFWALTEAGVSTTLNTDDPGYLGIDLTGEFVKAAAQWAWDLPTAAAVTRRAIDAAFCPPETAARLHAELDTYLERTAP